MASLPLQYLCTSLYPGRVNGKVDFLGVWTWNIKCQEKYYKAFVLIFWQLCQSAIFCYKLTIRLLLLLLFCSKFTSWSSKDLIKGKLAMTSQPLSFCVGCSVYRNSLCKVSFLRGQIVLCRRIWLLFLANWATTYGYFL